MLPAAVVEPPEEDELEPEEAGELAAVAGLDAAVELAGRAEEASAGGEETGDGAGTALAAGPEAELPAATI